MWSEGIGEYGIGGERMETVERKRRKRCCGLLQNIDELSAIKDWKRRGIEYWADLKFDIGSLSILQIF